MVILFECKDEQVGPALHCTWQFVGHVITLNIGQTGLENSADPDQMPHYAASDQDLHCLPLIQHYFRHINKYR